MKTPQLPIIKQPGNQSSKQWPQCLAVFTASLTALGCGIQFGWPSPTIPKLLAGELSFPISEEEASYVLITSPLAYIIGSPVAAYLVDKIGRKPTILLLAVPQIIHWIFIANAQSVFTLCIAKFIGGIAEGALFTCLPMYVGEVCEPKVRGLLGSCHSVLTIIGMLLVNVYGSFLSIEATAYWSIVVPALLLLTFVWMPESPYYYLMKNKEDDARTSLKMLRGMKDVEVELKRLVSDVQRQISEPGTIKDVFMIDSNRKGFLILLGMRTCQQFCGISAFNFYNQYIFQQSGSNLSPIASALTYFAVQLVMTLLGSIIIDKFGRRVLLIYSCIGTCISVFAEGGYFYFLNQDYDMSCFMWFPLFMMVVFIVVYSPGLGLCPNLMSGEMLSAKVKAKALGILNMALAITVTVSVKIFQVLNGMYGMHVPFFTFGVCCVISTMFSYFFVPETKGKTLEEIQQALKGNDITIKRDSNRSRA